MQFVILDTETTGADEKDRICQLAYLVAEPNLIGSEIVEIHDTLCHPPVPISFGAMAVHHITPEMVEKKPPCLQTKAFGRLLELNLPQNYLVIHNAPFDLNMLQKEGFEPRMKLIDTLRCLRHLYPEEESHALQYARYRFGLYKREAEEAENAGIKIAAHDALGDVLVLKLLLDFLLQDHTPDELVKLTNRPIDYPFFKFGKYRGERVADVARKDPGYLEWLLAKEEDMLDEDWRFTLQKALEDAKEEAVWLMPFGKYRGQSVEEIAVYDRNYLRWVLENNEISSGMKEAIRRVLEA